MVSPMQPSAPTQPATLALDPVLLRTERLRRHGLDISDADPNRVCLLLDIPHTPECSASALQLIESITDVVAQRMRTKEFCNSHAPLKRKHGRVMIRLITDLETPFGIYDALYEKLLHLQEIMIGYELLGETEEESESVANSESSGEYRIELQWAKDMGEPSARVWLASALMNRYRR
ncbi:hypothetical protein BDV06DRAFT_220289 [Aspergillus oleicola]